MKNKKGQNTNKDSSIKSEETFFVQSNIDDLLTNDSTEVNKNSLQNKQEDKKNSNQNKEKIEFSTEKDKNTNNKNIEEDKNIINNQTIEGIEKFSQIKDDNIENSNKYDEDNNQNIDSENSYADQKKKLDEAEQSVSKHNSKKSKIISLVFFIVNIFVVAGILAYQFTREEIAPIEGLRLDISYIFIVILFFCLVQFFETLALGYLVKQSTGKWRLGLSYKVVEIGRYYDNVTPLSSGGQPFQISYMKSRGMPLHTSLSIPLAKYVFHQMAWVVLSLICLIISSTNNNFSKFTSITSILGFILGAIILFVTIFLSICKSLGKKIVVKVLKLLHKMKIVKNYDKQYEKISKYISDFQDVMKQYAKSPKDFIVMFFTCFIKLTCNYCMPFFIVKLFMPGLEGSMFLNLFVMSMLVDLSSSFFPLPGGTGMNEISFTAAFASVIGEGNILVWVLLVWRFFSYYIYLLQGVCILSYDMAYGNRKYKWQVKKDKLVEESMIFKQNQIDKFKADRNKRRKIKQKNAKIKEYL